jgi:hypothetical protein
LVMSLTAVHAVFWSNMRMRGPLMSTIYLVAAMQVVVRSPSPRPSSATVRRSA